MPSLNSKKLKAVKYVFIVLTISWLTVGPFVKTWQLESYEDDYVSAKHISTNYPLFRGYAEQSDGLFVFCKGFVHEYEVAGSRTFMSAAWDALVLYLRHEDAKRAAREADSTLQELGKVKKPIS